MTGAPEQRPAGVRGHELDTQLSFARPLSRALAAQTLSGWGLPAELYGQGDEVRGARLTGDLDREQLHALLRSGFEDGLLRGAEVGRRGFLRSTTGSTEWMPWRRNVILTRDRIADVTLEDGLRYVLE